MDKEKKCWVCGRTDFESWGDLADHKLKSKDKAHRKDKAGRIWAANFKYKNSLMKQKDKSQYRTPVTAEQQEVKKDTRRKLSGDTELVPVKCPRCKNDSRQYLEAEHTKNPQALIIDNRFVKLCTNCGGSYGH